MPTCELGPHLSLSYNVLGNLSGKKTVIFLHGIMGSKKNLNAFVQKFVSAHQSFTALVFDMRNHGESSKKAEPFSIQAAADDIVRAMTALKIAPCAIVGHSFGGKVAVLVAEKLPSIEQVWVWDSVPEAAPKPLPLRDPRSFTAFEIMDVLEKLPWPMPTRSAVSEALEALGVSKGIALWMSTNLKTVEGGFDLVFFVPELREMLLSYLRLDVWPVIGRLATEKKIHLVAASRGGRLGPKHREKLLRLSPQNAYFHVVDNAGHFLHSDNPQAVLAIMADHFA